MVLGVNVDDVDGRDHRPGQRAAVEAGAAFPLVAAGFTKAEVRQASRRLGLRTWDKPAAACLASRIPYGTEVSVAVLSRVERAEAALRSLGFRQVRVRHYGDTARIEVELAELDRVVGVTRGDRGRRAAAPATATSRSTSRASARAISTSDAAAEAPGGAGVPNRVFDAERRDPGP